MDPIKFFYFPEKIYQSSNFTIDEETDCRTGYWKNTIGRTHYSIFLEFRGLIDKKIETTDVNLARKYKKLQSGKLNHRGSLIHKIVPEVLTLCDPHYS